MVRQQKKNRHEWHCDYQFPAEWERHRATWLTYPASPISFRNCLPDVQRIFLDFVTVVARTEMVYLNVADRTARAMLEQAVRERGIHTNVVFHAIPVNDAWCRDYGALFVKHKHTGALAATRWRFNAWGGKYPHDLDDKVASAMAAYVGCEQFEVDIVLEGGSIDGNGQGLLLTTESCLLNKNRNPHLTKKDIERRLQAYLGTSNVIWLAGGLEGDDTDGHVDDVARFVSPQTIVTAVEEHQEDANYDILQQNLKRLKTATDAHGELFRIIALPMPQPQYYEGQRLPATYLNFYIANQVVVVPQFGCPSDAVALETLRILFKDRTVVGIDSRQLIVGLGSFHCLSQQVPV